MDDDEDEPPTIYLDDTWKLRRQAVLDNEINGLQNLLDDSIDVDAVMLKEGNPHDGSNMLHLASSRGHIEIVSLLLKRGAKVNCRDMDRFGDCTALHYAAASYRTAAIRTLLGAGADIKAIREDFGSPLKNVLYRREHSSGETHKIKSTFVALFEWEADVNEGSPEEAYDDGHVLSQAARAGNLELVKWLVEQGANVHAAGNAGANEALYYAATNGSYSVVIWLLAQGARDSDASSLARAAWLDRLDLCFELFPTARTATASQLAGALITAARNGDIDVIGWLLDQGLDVNQKDAGLGATALREAAAGRTYHGREKLVVSLLIDRGAHVLSEDQATQQRIAQLLKKPS